MTLRGFRSPAGFTLVELLIGASLSAIVLAGVLSSYVFLGRQLGRLANQQTLETEARRALAYFEQDVQRASGLVTVSTSPISPAANRVDLTVPTATTTTTITYYYNNTSSAATVAINGTNVSMAANALTRCVYNGSTVTSLTLLRNITSSGLTLNYYDSSGNIYTTYTDYLPGIKQLAVQFSTQIVTTNQGTTTPVQQVTSSRLVLRNRGFLQ